METNGGNSTGPIDWDSVIKKEARGIDDYDLGEVQEVTADHVLTQKGIVDKKWFQIPKNLAQGFDGDMLTFNVTEAQAKDTYVIDKPASAGEEEEDVKAETTVPLVEERLEPTKREVIEEAKVVKEPVTETKQIEVQLTHEELVIERRPLDEPRPAEQEPVESRTEIKIPLKREEIELNKQSYVNEEIIAKKKSVTETRTISEEVRSEKVENLDDNKDSYV
jgi:uncharacterized protein (TIGR02271 family)